MGEVSTAELHEAADTAIEQGDFPAALLSMTGVLSVVPQDHRARLKLGRSLAMLRRTDDAVAVLSTAIEQLTAGGFMLSAIATGYHGLGFALGAPPLWDALAQIHRRISGRVAIPRARVPPPIPPAFVPADVVQELEALEAEALGARAVTVGRRGPPVTTVEATGVPLFSDLPREAFLALVPKLEVRRFAPDHAVVNQGDRGVAVYLLVDGEVEVVRTKDDGSTKVLTRLPAGSVFGEMALVSQKPRSASVRPVSAGEVLVIPTRELEALAHTHPEISEKVVTFVRRRLLLNVMQASPIFEPFTGAQRLEILGEFQSRMVAAGETLIQEGSKPDGLYLVMEGQVEISKVDEAGDRVMLAYLREGEVFGEIGLIEDRPATAQAVATERTTVLWLDKARFDAFTQTHAPILEYLRELGRTRKHETEHALTAEGIILDADDLAVL